ncbi:MAG: hypothetical protein ISS53_04570 [Dehalococcoidia bacterium]|nr:hypothetical protein [Dehalococcoidia bacterium]
MQAGIADRSTTIDTYRDVFGRKGTHQDNLAVFRRTGKPCFDCGAPIIKTRVGGRETFFCPQCQK